MPCPPVAVTGTNEVVANPCVSVLAGTACVRLIAAGALTVRVKDELPI